MQGWRDLQQYLTGFQEERHTGLPQEIHTGLPKAHFIGLPDALNVVTKLTHVPEGASLNIHKAFGEAVKAAKVVNEVIERLLITMQSQPTTRKAWRELFDRTHTGNVNHSDLDLASLAGAVGRTLDALHRIQFGINEFIRCLQSLLIEYLTVQEFEVASVDWIDITEQIWTNLLRVSHKSMSNSHFKPVQRH